jgi:hypothetical protein
MGLFFSLRTETYAAFPSTIPSEKQGHYPLSLIILQDQLLFFKDELSIRHWKLL